MKSGTYQKKYYPKKKSEEKEKPATIERKINVKNTPYLVIVESPSKCKKIEKYLGFQYKCIASKGHICNISKVKKDFEPEFEILSEKKDHVKSMREIISVFDPKNIYLGTDDDREGEAIAWHICLTFGLPVETTHRIIFHEITESAIRAAVAFPIVVRMNIVNAQKARQVLDRLVGFEISPLLTKRLGTIQEKKSLSAGRCQTPALRLVYDLDQANEKKERSFQYQTTGTFFESKIPAILNHHFETEKECETFLEESKTFSHIYSLETPVNKQTSAPCPFNTSTLLQYASVHLHLSPKQTMNYCQTLYQNGHITYMRTESTKYSLEFLNKIRECFDDPTWIGDLAKIQNHNHNNPHEAIRITNLEKCHLEEKDMDHVDDKAGFSRLKAVFDMIRYRTIESCMSDYQYREIQVKIRAPQDKEYIHNLEIPVFLGWKRCKWIEPEFLETQKKQTAFYFSLQHKSKKIADLSKIECIITSVNRTRHYTESGLIKKLEDLGIGRPSTFATIIETIQERKYVEKQDIEGEKKTVVEYELDGESKNIQRIEKERIFGAEKNKLILQDLGKTVIQELIPTFTTLFEYEYTKTMEESLDLVSENSLEWQEVCKKCAEEIKKESKTWKEEIQEIYKIDEIHELVFSKKGAMIRKPKLDQTHTLKKKTEYEYLSTRKKIDLEKLKKGEYTLEDLLEIPREYLGDYLEKEVHLKKGPYGAYVLWGEETIKTPLKKDAWEITFEDIIDILEFKTKVLPPNVLRVLTENMTLRKGKFGPYVYYKPPEKEKPAFYNLKAFIQKKNVYTCEISEILKWIEETYGIV
jgi:DNA topoisomerase-1